MYTGHFAAGLALKSHVPETPTWILITGVFIPDFLWIAFARAGIEPTRPEAFFDDWSHSLLMVIVWATIYACMFWKLGRPVIVAAWIAVFSHFLLDMPIHPKRLALYPYSSVHIGWVASHGVFALKNWLVELFVVIALSVVYVIGAKRNSCPANLIAATLVLVGGLQLLSLL